VLVGAGVVAVVVAIWRDPPRARLRAVGAGVAAAALVGAWFIRTTTSNVATSPPACPSVP